MPEQPLLTTKEALKLLRISLSTFYRLRQAGELPAVKVGHAWRIDRTKLDRWLDQPTTVKK